MRIAARLQVPAPGVYTLTVQMREDGIRLDRLLLTTDTTYTPADFGPAETAQLTTTTGIEFIVDRKIDYDYDNLYRLTNADYSTGQSYEYDYDPVGNRLQQIINGDTTNYLYDAANRLATVNGQAYTYDNNGNLLSTGEMTNTFDTANRLVETKRNGTILQPLYNGVNDRIGQTVETTTTHFALDIPGLPKVIYTSNGDTYLHLPGIIVTEKNNDAHYLLSDGLGSVRQVVDESVEVVVYNEFDPYGTPVQNSGGKPYGYAEEWWEDAVELLHLRARWYLPETGTFLNRDAWSGDRMRPNTLHGYSYAANNPIRYTDPAGFDYIERLDRYTCDDPKAKGGYVHHFDRATGTTGRWPCIVDPNNVQAGYVQAGTSPPPPPPPPPPTPPNGCPTSNCCGPQIDNWFVGEIQAHWNWVKAEKYITVDVHMDNPDSGVYIGAMGYWPLKVGSYLGGIPHKWMQFNHLVPDCPSGDGTCKNTVTLCGTCLERSELGNLLFGMSANLAGIGNAGTYFAGHYYATGLQKPWDQAVAGVGFHLATVPSPPTSSSAMCSIFQASTGVWSDPLGSNPAPWNWNLVQDDSIKGCRACSTAIPASTPHTIPSYTGDRAGFSPHAGAPIYEYFTEQIPDGMLDQDIRDTTYQ